MMEYLKNVATLELDSGLCTGCNRCVEVCPHEVFERVGKTVEARNRDRCIECGACMMNCEFGAIHVQAGVGCAAAVLNGLVHKGEPNCDCTSTKCC